MLQRIRQLRNVGRFHDVDASDLPFAKFTLIYAENGRGKTTLGSILRSLSTGEPKDVMDRKRLHPDGNETLDREPHIVLEMSDQRAVFRSGRWTAAIPEIVVFDDEFVDTNVFSGIEVEPGHQRNLHEVIIGAEGVRLSQKLQEYVQRIEASNSELRRKLEAIPKSLRGDLSVDDFCSLQAQADLDDKIQSCERALAAAKAADDIQGSPSFPALSLPRFDVASISSLLARTLPDLQAEAAARVRAHLEKLGTGGEAWVAEGVRRSATAVGTEAQPACPFCAQPLGASSLVKHYDAYFSEAYRDLTAALSNAVDAIERVHGGAAQAAFERTVRVAIERRSFWQRFLAVPEIGIDTETITRNWTEARDAVLAALRTKMRSPFEHVACSEQALKALADFHERCEEIAALAAELEASNRTIEVTKEGVERADVAALTRELNTLKLTKLRHSPEVDAVCSAYLKEKQEKGILEALRDQTRKELDQYRENVFPAFENAINQYLDKFGAEFQLQGLRTVNHRGGSSADYHLAISRQSVKLITEAGPSFRSTLSAGDRNTLALAFFFASLDRCPDLAQKIVVLDDPMTSFDEHRSRATVQKLCKLVSRVDQLIVLSHSKAFLCNLWEEAEKDGRAALESIRSCDGSRLARWDVNRDCVTMHDRRHEMVRSYIREANPAAQRAVAEALRPILEAFMRVAYPGEFPPGSLLGPFLNRCEQRVARDDKILNQADIDELRDLLRYANRFHHDTNPVWQGETINDQELLKYARRTLRFASRCCRGN